jgi:hypothetical protein
VRSVLETMTTLRLPSPDAPESERYVMPDPYALHEAYARVHHASYRGIFYGEDLKRDDVKAVLELARGYLDLTTYPLGQETCVGKLRDIWRALRKRTKAQP